ncbi:shikimate kinase [Anaerocolumna sp.]|uniref:shikimate kinase n=1 Tax=Anaerocolumna sp. TaxID=2041569 RepID=UPI0028AE3AC0|nr:shikimate kinase [Anaerocolumna sp.]
MNNIILIGFMGSGKTSVGRQLAKKLQYTFCDTDELIEKENKNSIRNIFAAYGEEYFRKLETAAINELYGNMTRTVLSTGGGLPITEGNDRLLRRLGHVIYLKASQETLMKRLQGDTSRPLLGGEKAEERVYNLLQQRTPIYEKTAHYSVTTDHRKFYEIIDEIIDLCNI